MTVIYLWADVRAQVSVPEPPPHPLRTSTDANPHIQNLQGLGFQSHSPAMDCSTCQHRIWLESSFAKFDRHIIHHQRLHKLAARLPNPATQAPSIVLLLGNQTKDRFLKVLLPEGDDGGEDAKTSCLSLRADPQSLNAAYPRYYADLDPIQGLQEQAIKASCHLQQRLQVSWSPESPKELSDAIVARLLFLFADVICLFVDDLGGMEAVNRLLISWARLNKASSSAKFRPSVLLLHEDYKDDMQRLTADSFVYELDAGLASYSDFADVESVTLPGAYKRNKLQRDDFRKQIKKHVDRVRGIRMESSYLFSANHQAALFQRALSSLSRTDSAIFDFLRAARQDDVVRPELVHYTEKVHELSKRVSSGVFPSILASSTLLDAYPAGMHGEVPLLTTWQHELIYFVGFDALTLFRSLYLPMYRSAFSRGKRALQPEAAEDLCRQVEERFRCLRDEMLRDNIIALEVHLTNLRSVRKDWSQLKSNQACLFCLARSPEHVLSCGHALCETCVRRNAREASQTSGLYNSYELQECPLCGKREILLVRLKPPTAGVRMLSVDGGGIRGIVPLESLSLLQQLMPDCPVQELFDLASGTSIGQ